MIWVTIAILDAAWMTYNGEIFHNHEKKSYTALNSIAERQRYPASMADKQSSFPELYAALRHILILYSLRCSMRHKLVGYKVLIKCFHGKLNVSLFIS